MKLDGIMEVLKDIEYKFVGNILQFTCTVRYILDKNITKKQLKDDIQGIFDHWRNAGDFAVTLEKFTIIKTDKKEFFIVLNNKSFKNIL